MLAHLCLIGSLALPSSDLRFEDHDLATIPEGVSLEGPPMQHPDGGTIEVRSPVHWSPDGRQVAYVGFQEGQRVAVVGEHLSEPVDYLSSVSFGDRGDDVVFRMGERVTKKKEKWYLYYGPDKKRSKAFDWIGAPAMAPDGSRVVVWNQPGAKIGKDGYYVRKNLELHGGWKKKKKRWNDALALTAPSFSADGKRVFTAALKDGTWSVLRLDKSGEKELVRHQIAVRDVAVGPGAKDVAATVLVQPARDVRGNTDPNQKKLPAGAFGPPGMNMVARVLFDDEHLGEAYDASWDAAFSPNGKHLAYKVLRGDKMGVAAGSKDDAPTEWDYVTRPVFSPDGKRVAFVANTGTDLTFAYRTMRQADRQQRAGRDQVHVFPTKSPSKTEPLGEPAGRIEHLTFDPRGEQLAYAAHTEDGWRVHCGDFQSQPYDEIGELHFNDKGTQIGFGARTDRELFWRTLSLEE